MTREFWDGLSLDDELIGPPLLFSECTSVLRGRVFDGLLEHQEALEAVGDMSDLPIRLFLDSRQYSLALQIANRTRRRKSYDMQYVAVAVLEGCEMVTLDGGVYQAARDMRIPARLLR